METVMCLSNRYSEKSFEPMDKNYRRVLFSMVDKVVVQEFNRQRNMQLCNTCYHEIYNATLPPDWLQSMS